MFSTLQKDKKLQCSSEFGLYKCDSDDESTNQKKKPFGFHYFVVLLTSFILLSAICLVTYSYVQESTTEKKINSIPSPPKLTSSENYTKSSASNLNQSEPIALKLRSNRRSEDPRPFIYEMRDPKPRGFYFGDQKPQSQNIYNHRHRAKNIQEIIKMLEQNESGEGRRKKNSKRKSSVPDPFFPYKPQSPSDVNLLSNSGFRFAPTVEMEITKSPVVTEYPVYEIPKLQNQNNPLSLTLDVKNNQQYTNRNHNQKHLYSNYFNQANRFHQNRVQPQWNRPYWNGLRNQVNTQQNIHPNTQSNILSTQSNIHSIQSNVPPITQPNVFLNAQPNGYSNTQPMIVHLNVFPKKKNKPKDQKFSESNVHHNCTDEEDVFSHIKNATQLNHLFENMRSKHNLYKIKDTILQLHKPDPNNYNEKSQNVDVQKSIGFTIIDPKSNQYLGNKWKPMVVPLSNDENEQNNNYQDYRHSRNNENNNDQIDHTNHDYNDQILKDHYYNQQIPNHQIPNNHDYNEQTDDSNQHHIPDFKQIPHDINDQFNQNDQPDYQEDTNNNDEFNHHFGLEVGEVDEKEDENIESVTLPVPNDVFQKYFNTKPPKKDADDWDWYTIKKNPNLANHRPQYEDE